MDTVCDLDLVEKKQFVLRLPWFVSPAVKLQLSVIISVDTARGFVDNALLISNYIFFLNKKARTLGRMCFHFFFFPLSEAQLWQAEVALVHCSPQHHLALILCPDVGIWLCTTAYGSTYSPGEENKWFVFLLWSRSLCTYKTSF